MSVINTNITSMIGQQNLNKSQNALQTSMERLSSGLRINSAKDDAAGQAIANRMTAQISGLAQAQRNANDGISIAQTTEGGLNQINDNLQRIRELTVQAANGTNSQNDLQSIQDEVTQRLNEINRISEETDFNGTRVLSEAASSLTIQVGAEDGQTISVNIQTINSNSLGLADFDVRKAQAVEVENVNSVGGDPVAVQAAADIDLTPAGLAGAGGAAQGVFEDENGNYFVQITGSDDAADNGFYAADVDNTDGTVTITGTSPEATALTAAGDTSSLGGTPALGSVYENGGNYFVEVTGAGAGENGLYAATLDASTGEVTITDATNGVVSAGAQVAAGEINGGDFTDLPTAFGFDTGATFDSVQVDEAGNYFVNVTGSGTGSENGLYAVTLDEATGEFTGTLTPGTTATATGSASPVTAGDYAFGYTDTGGSIATPASEFTSVSEVPGASAVDVTFATDAVTAGIDTPQLVQLTAEDGTEVYAIQDANGDRFAADVDETTGVATAQSVTYTDEAGVEQTSAVQLGGIDGVTGFVTVTDAEGNDVNYSSEALDGTDLQTAENVAQVSLAQTTDPLAQLDDALKQVDSLRSELGAVQNRFESAIENLSTNETNLSAARSRIEDADYAVEVADMTRAQILQQAGTSVLAQANQIPQNVLSLLG